MFRKRNSQLALAEGEKQLDFPTHARIVRYVFKHSRAVSNSDMRDPSCSIK